MNNISNYLHHLQLTKKKHKNKIAQNASHAVTSAHPTRLAAIT
jgi:hypothetical protein